MIAINTTLFKKKYANQAQFIEAHNFQFGRVSKYEGIKKFKGQFFLVLNDEVRIYFDKYEIEYELSELWIKDFKQTREKEIKANKEFEDKINRKCNLCGSRETCPFFKSNYSADIRSLVCSKTHEAPEMYYDVDALFIIRNEANPNQLQ